MYFEKKKLPRHYKLLLETAFWGQNHFHNCNTSTLFCISFFLHLLTKWEKLENAIPEQFPLPASFSLPQFPRASVWSREVPCSKHLLCLQPRVRDTCVNQMFSVPVQTHWDVQLRNTPGSGFSISFSCPLMAHTTFWYQIPIYWIISLFQHLCKRTLWSIVYLCPGGT